MKNLTFFFLLILATLNTKAQTLQGKVVDGKTGESIPFVSLGIVGTFITTVTNDNGEFVIKAEKLPLKLRFSHVSYQLKEVEVENNNSLVIKLSPAAISLNEVVIRPDQAKMLLRNAFLKAVKNIDKNAYYQAFYRQLTSTDQQPTEIHELFYSLRWNARMIDGWKANQSRFAEIDDPNKFSLSNTSFLTFAFAGYLLPEKRRRYITLKYMDDYEIQIIRYISQQDQDIAVISCKLKKTRKNQFYANSVYYVGLKDQNIYRLENQIHNMPCEFSPGLSLRLPSYVETVSTFNLQSPNATITSLESMSTKVYLPLKNRGREINSVISSLLMVIKVDDKLKNQHFQALNGDVKDQRVIKSMKYDAAFWKDNPIVKKTVLEDNFIKMMENKQAFGTMVNP